MHEVTEVNARPDVWRVSPGLGVSSQSRRELCKVTVPSPDARIMIWFTLDGV